MNKHRLYETFSTYGESALKLHMVLCSTYEKSSALYDEAMEQLELCKYILAEKRYKPKEPDICDIIAQEAA